MLAGLQYFALRAGTVGAGSGGDSPIVMIATLAFAIFLIASMWKVFEKAGEPGWASIVPIYNLIVLLRIARKPVWWAILMVIPLVNLIAFIVVGLAIAERFGKGAGFGLGLTFLGFIFYPVLAYGDAEYSPA